MVYIHQTQKDDTGLLSILTRTIQRFRLAPYTSMDQLHAVLSACADSKWIWVGQIQTLKRLQIMRTIRQTWLSWSFPRETWWQFCMINFHFEFAICKMYLNYNFRLCHSMELCPLAHKQLLRFLNRIRLLESTHRAGLESKIYSFCICSS